MAYALLGGFFFATTVMAIGLAVGVRGPDMALLFWAGLAIMIALVPLCLDLGRPRLKRHLFLSMLSISYMVNFVLPVFTHYIPAVGPTDPAAMAYSNLLPRDVARGQAMAILGLLFFYMGYALPIRAFIRPTLPSRLLDWSQRGALIASCTWLLLGWFVFITGSAGLIPRELGSGWLSGFASGTLYGSALLAATYLKYRSRAAQILLVILLPATTIVMFMTGSKTAVLMPAAMVVMTWVVVQRRIRARWIVAGFLALMMLYPVAQFWRHDILQANTLTIADVVRNPRPALQRTARFLSTSREGDYFRQGFIAAGRRLDAIGVASVIIRDTPSVSPFQNGRTLALVPIGLVPRILWPSKPTIPIGRWISHTYTRMGYKSESSLSVTWIGEFYLNYGTVGVVIGMLVLGLMLRSTHESLMRLNMSIPLIAASVIVLHRLLLGVQGSLSSIINTTLIALIPLFLIHLLIRSLGVVRAIPPDEESAGPGSASPNPARTSSSDLQPPA